MLCLCNCCRNSTIERLSKGKVVTLQDPILFITTESRHRQKDWYIGADIGADIDSNISQRWKKCFVLLYISKNFKKHKKVCNICCYMLDNELESGPTPIVYIFWTENQKFRVFRNVYLQNARNLMELRTTESSVRLLY